MNFPDNHAELDVCHVTTTGRRSGNPHRIEIWFGAHAGVLYLISGNGPGAHWFLNMQAHPEVLVEIGDDTRTGMARVVNDPAERRLVGDIMGAKHAGWDGDPDIGLTFAAWCYEVPVAAIGSWIEQAR